MIYEVKETEKVSELFEGWQEILIWSCLQKVMRHLYTNCKANPVSGASSYSAYKKIYERNRNRGEENNENDRNHNSGCINNWRIYSRLFLLSKPPLVGERHEETYGIGGR